jgi:hypothetical protein
MSNSDPLPAAPACYLQAARAWQLAYHVRTCPACRDYLYRLTQYAETARHPELSEEEIEAS